VRSLMNEYGLSREGALRFLQTQALHHELDLRDAALNVVVPGAAMDRPGPEVSGLRQEPPDGVEDFRLLAPAELEQESETSPAAGAAKKQRPRSTVRRRTA
jgi:hypothetical protein